MKMICLMCKHEDGGDFTVAQKGCGIWLYTLTFAFVRVWNTGVNENLYRIFLYMHFSVLRYKYKFFLSQLFSTLAILILIDPLCGILTKFSISATHCMLSTSTIASHLFYLIFLWYNNFLAMIFIMLN